MRAEARALGKALLDHSVTSLEVCLGTAVSPQHADLSEALLAGLMVEDPLLLCTPIVRAGARAAVGADEATWRELAEAAKPGRRPRRR